MSEASKVLEAIKADRIVAVVRAGAVADPQGLVRALAEAGIRCVEFTYTIPRVAEVIEDASRISDALVGAGTVVDEAQAREAIAAGARFVVSPITQTALVPVCDAEDVPVILGAFSPSEVAAVAASGAIAVKLFPARMGPAYVKDLLGPFPDLSLIPSGGISAENARAFLDSGAVAVYAGSSMVPSDAVERGDNDEVAQRARAFVAAIA